jgi:hypothetical protein
MPQKPNSNEKLRKPDAKQNANNTRPTKIPPSRRSNKKKAKAKQKNPLMPKQKTVPNRLPPLKQKAAKAKQKIAQAQQNQTKQL